MTAPSIAPDAVFGTTPNGTSHVITLPSGCAVGDFVLVAFIPEANATLTVTSTGGFAIGFGLPYNSSAARIRVVYAPAITTASPTLSFTTSVACTGIFVAMRIPASQGAALAVTPDTTTTGASGNIDPPALTETTAYDTLWLVIGGLASATAPAAAPSGYTSLGTKSGVSNSLAVASRQALAATTEDPGAFTNTSAAWGAFTLGITASIAALSGAPVEGNDSLAATGALPIQGAAAPTEANDTVSATGIGPALLVGSPTEANDTVSATGIGPALLVGSPTEANDSASGTGIAPAQGTLAATEANDTVSATGAHPVSGTLAATEGNDGTVSALAVTSSLPRILPFSPNWASNVTVTLEFKTDVFVARSGREQRRALRNSPRRGISFTALLATDDSRAFNRLAAVWQNRPFLTGDPVRLAPLTSAVDVGATVLHVESVPQWLVSGAAILIDSGAAQESAIVQSVSGTTVTLPTPLANAWPVTAVVRPALLGLIGTSINASRYTNTVSAAPLNFSVRPGSETYPTTVPSADAFQGREVLTKRFNWSTVPTTNLMWDRETIDFGYGTIDTDWPFTFPSAAASGSALLNGTNEIDELVAFFVRQNGRLGEFLAPTWLDDIPLAATAPAGSSTIETPGDLVADFSDHPVYQAIAIVFHDDRTIFRKIVSMTLSGPNSVLQLDREFYFDVSPADVAMICWLPVVRFASDTLTLEYSTAEVAQATLATQTLEYLPAEGAVPDYDGAAYYAYETMGPGIADAFSTFDWAVNVRYPEIAG